MKRTRRGLSAHERAQLWRRWKAGESLSEIARALERLPGSLHGVLAATGGIAPPTRVRAAIGISLHEREDISRGLSAGESIRTIAAQLGRAPSTISREVARNGGSGRYRAVDAEKSAWDRARRPKPCKLAVAPALREFVASRLALDWSPEQIAGWLKAEHPDDDVQRVSHETIYRSLFIQARGVLRKEPSSTARS